MKAANIGAMSANMLKSLLVMTRRELLDAREKQEGRAMARYAAYVDVFETALAERTTGKTT